MVAFAGPMWKTRLEMRKVGFGETNLGAVAGTVVAGIGGLFAIGIAWAIMERDPSLLFRTPSLNLISWLFCMPCGWVVGGQLGPRVGEPLRSQRAEVIAGAFGGLVPVLIIAVVGWYIATAF